MFISLHRVSYERKAQIKDLLEQKEKKLHINIGPVSFRLSAMCIPKQYILITTLGTDLEFGTCIKLG